MTQTAARPSRPGVETSRSVTAIMLAGRLRPSPLRHALDTPTLCLPLGPAESLFAAWMKEIRAIDGCRDVVVVVNTAEDAAAIRSHALNVQDGGPAGTSVRVMVEPASWRGAAGLLRDVATDAAPASIVVAIEVLRSPLGALGSLVGALAPDLDGVVGVTRRGEPNGVYAFRSHTLDAVPALGYFDVKEQLLPRLHERSARIRPFESDDDVLRIHDRRSYLMAVRHRLAAFGPGPIPSTARVDPGARIAGGCLVGPDAVIEAGAIVHDSVVLEGARVGERAVVSRSVVARHSEVPAGTKVVRQIVLGRRIGRPDDVEREPIASVGERVA